MNANKIALPVSIVLGCLILGGFFYSAQLEKQKSIERQQMRQLEDNRVAREQEKAIPPEMSLSDLGQKLRKPEAEISDQQSNNAASLSQCIDDADIWVDGAVDAVVNLPPDPSNAQALDVIQKGYEDMKEECFRIYQ